MYNINQRPETVSDQKPTRLMSNILQCPSPTSSDECSRSVGHGDQRSATSKPTQHTYERPASPPVSMSPEPEEHAFLNPALRTTPWSPQPLHVSDGYQVATSFYVDYPAEQDSPQQPASPFDSMSSELMEYESRHPTLRAPRGTPPPLHVPDGYQWRTDFLLYGRAEQHSPQDTLWLSDSTLSESSSDESEEYDSLHPTLKAPLISPRPLRIPDGYKWKTHFRLDGRAEHCITRDLSSTSFHASS